MKNKKLNLKELKELEEFYKAMDEDLFNDYTTEDLIKMEEEFMKEEQAKYIEETKKDYGFEEKGNERGDL